MLQIREVDCFRIDIKGYHKYHIRPSVDESLYLERNMENVYDENAIFVKMPTGNTVGHVPAICVLFCQDFGTVPFNTD